MAPNPFLYTLDRPLNRADLLAALAGTPETLRSLFDDADLGHVTQSAVPGEWPAFKILCHLRDAAIAYSARFRWMVFDDDPLLPNYDENRWVEDAVDTPADIPQILDFIAATRGDLVRMLTRMPADAWQRTGRHEIAGSIVLEDYVRHQLAHEESHLAQVRAILEAANR